MCSSQKVLEPLSFLLTRFVLFPSCLVFLPLLSLIWISCQGCWWLLLFFRGLSGIDLSAFLYFNSGFVSKKMMMKWMVVLLLFVFGCHKLFRPIFLYSCCFFFLEFIVLVWVFRKFIVPSFLSLWSLSCCIFDLLLIFLFSIGLTVILDCFHHFFFDLTT